MFCQSMLRIAAAVCVLLALGVDGHKIFGDRVRARNQRAAEYIRKPQKVEARDDSFRYLTNQTTRTCCYTPPLAALPADS